MYQMQSIVWLFDLQYQKPHHQVLCLHNKLQKYIKWNHIKIWMQYCFPAERISFTVLGKIYHSLYQQTRVIIPSWRYIHVVILFNSVQLTHIVCFIFLLYRSGCQVVDQLIYLIWMGNSQKCCWDVKVINKTIMNNKYSVKLIQNIKQLWFNPNITCTVHLRHIYLIMKPATILLRLLITQHEMSVTVLLWYWKWFM